jgi:hypothetical protein
VNVKFVLFIQEAYNMGDHIKGDGMGGACNTRGRENKCVLNVVRKIDLREIGWEDVVWIYLEP